MAVETCKHCERPIRRAGNGQGWTHVVGTRVCRRPSGTLAAPGPQRDPRTTAFERLDETLFACADAGISHTELLAHIAGHEIAEGE